MPLSRRFERGRHHRRNRLLLGPLATLERLLHGLVHRMLLLQLVTQLRLLERAAQLRGRHRLHGASVPC